MTLLRRSGRAQLAERARTAAGMAELEPWENELNGNGRPDRDGEEDRRRRTAAELAESSPWREAPRARTRRSEAPRQANPRYEVAPREDGQPSPRRPAGPREPYFAPPPDTRTFQALRRIRRGRVDRGVPAPTEQPTPPTEHPALRRAADAGRRAGHYAAASWRQRRPWLIVAGLVVIGLILRLVLMRSIWVDEAISIHQAHMSLGGMLDNLRATDRHPPLHYVVLWFTVRLFGDGELAVRAPSILASAALIPVMFATGRELFDRRTGLVAAGLATLAPLIIWYGQEARMYALFMLLGTLALWAQVKVLREGRPRHWVIYGGVTIALLYTHYFALIPIAIQQVVFAVAAWKRASAGHPVRGLLIGTWITWAALLVAAAPLAPFAYDQFTQSQEAGMGFGGAPSAGAAAGQSGSSVSLYAVLSNFVWSIWGYHANSTMLRIAALWPLLMLLSVALLGQRRSASTRVVLALAIGPVVALLLIGLVKRDLFEVRYFVAAVPMMLLLLARAVAGGTRRRMPALVATGALTLSLVIGLADQQLNPNNPRDFDFKGALGVVRSEARPGDTVLYAPDYLRDVVEYYAPGIHAEPLSDAQGDPMPREGRVFVLASFLDDQTVAQQVGTTRSLLAQSHRRLIDTDNRKRIHIWEFS
jgi:hypothetical protein